MKNAVSQKKRLLFLLLLNMAGAITVITFFILSSEIDRFRIFMRGLMLCIFLIFLVKYGFAFLKESKKTNT